MSGYEKGFADGLDFYFYLQNYFSMGTVYELWPDSDKPDWSDPTKKYNYYWEKWENSGRNAVLFFNSFVVNGPPQLKLIAWWRRNTNL
jgi:hypothetical protein